MPPSEVTIQVPSAVSGVVLITFWLFVVVALAKRVSGQNTLAIGFGSLALGALIAGLIGGSYGGILTEGWRLCVFISLAVGLSRELARELTPAPLRQNFRVLGTSLALGLALAPHAGWLGRSTAALAGYCVAAVVLQVGLTPWFIDKRPGPRPAVTWPSLTWGGLNVALGILEGLSGSFALAALAMLSGVLIATWARFRKCRAAREQTLGIEPRLSDGAG